MKWLFTLVSILFLWQLYAQKNNTGFSTGVSVSRGGVSNQLGVHKSFKNHSYTVGGQKLLHATFFGQNRSQGIFANWKYSVGTDKIVSFIGVHSSYIIRKENLESSEIRPKIFELSIIQGLQYQFAKHFAIGEWVGIGRYAEYIKHPSTEQSKIIDWPDFSGKLYLIYLF